MKGSGKPARVMRNQRRRIAATRARGKRRKEGRKGVKKRMKKERKTAGVENARAASLMQM